ncbi:BolA family transcriptional regulator, partial [Candidatus Woesearchaeota archaeon]|nr:BolA family transcriptional regulator [Candidatus Woesearchaeota archaeon]
MLSIEEIKQKIEAGLPGAKVEMLDPRRDGVHLKAM